MAKAGIDIYMTFQTACMLKAENHRINIVKPRVSFDGGDFRILPFEVEHDIEGAVAFLIADIKAKERFLYITDTFYCKYRFSGLTGIAIEVNYSEKLLEQNIENGKTNSHLKTRIQRSHFSLEHVIEFFKANDLSNVREIHLLHASKTNCDIEYCKMEVQKTTGSPVYIAEG